MANLGRVKTQYDVFARNSYRHELFRERKGRPVILDPDLAALDVDVNDRSVHAPSSIPTHVNHLVVILFGVDDCLCFDLTVRGLVPGILLDQAADD
jgi:hypothetical protein